jgi:hypothetical protein
LSDELSEQAAKKQNAIDTAQTAAKESGLACCPVNFDIHDIINPRPFEWLASWGCALRKGGRDVIIYSHLY